MFVLDNDKILHLLMGAITVAAGGIARWAYGRLQAELKKVADLQEAVAADRQEGERSLGKLRAELEAELRQNATSLVRLLEERKAALDRRAESIDRRLGNTASTVDKDHTLRLRNLEQKMDDMLPWLTDRRDFESRVSGLLKRLGASTSDLNELFRKV